MALHLRAKRTFSSTKLAGAIVAIAALLLQPFASVNPAVVSAVAGSEVVYNALPSVTPSTNYPSYGAQAHQFNEFGDRVVLGGTNRVLNTVTATLSSWAKRSTASNLTFCTNNPAKCTDEGFYHPITQKVYKTDGTQIAAMTQEVLVPWRPESDPTCGSTSNGTGWKENGVCVNVSGIAFNVVSDMSASQANLPSELLLGVSYSTHRTLGVSGPYDSLNVTFPLNQPVSVGSDQSVGHAYVATSNPAYWGTSSPAFSAFETHSGYGTVAFQVTATQADTAAPVVGYNSPVEGTAARTTNLDFEIDDESTISQYSFNVVGPNGVNWNTKKWYPSASEVAATINLCDEDRLNRCIESGLQDGEYKVQALAYDNKGNDSRSQKRHAFYLDTTAPNGVFDGVPTAPQRGDVQISVDLEEVGMAGLGSQQIVMRDQAGAVAGNWEFNVKNGASRNISGPEATFSYLGSQMAGRLTVIFDSSSLNGTHSLRLFTKDQIGNGRSNIYSSISFDNSAPSTAFSSPSNGSEVRSTDVAGTISDNENVAQFSFNVSGPVSWSTRKWMPNLESVDFDLNLCEQDRLAICDESTLPEGMYTVRVAAYDGNGNRDISTNTSFQFVRETATVTNPLTPPIVGNPSGPVSQGGEPSSSARNSQSSQAAQDTGFFVGSVNTGVSESDSDNEQESGDILGTSSTEDEDSGDVAGASDKAGWSIGDMAWYWWVAGVLGLMALWLLIAAGIRRLRGTDA